MPNSEGLAGDIGERRVGVTQWTSGRAKGELVASLRSQTVRSKSPLRMIPGVWCTHRANANDRIGADHQSASTTFAGKPP